MILIIVVVVVSLEMVRPYGVKGRKRKKNREVYDKEEEEVHEEGNEVVDDEENVTKRSKAEEDEDEAKAQHVADELSGIPIGPLVEDDKKNGVIFILERASLEVAKVGKVTIKPFLLMRFWKIRSWVCVYTYCF